jgi:hypothetical protein
MLKGQGYCIWQIRQCEGGNLEQIADQAAASGFSHVLIKVADGPVLYNVAPPGSIQLPARLQALTGIRGVTSGIDLVPPLVHLLLERGVQPWLWQYVYGENPMGEADAALRTIAALFEADLPPAGFVVNAEAEYKLPGRWRAARAYMQVLSADLADLPIALSSYRWPSAHPEFPWDDFLQYCEMAMPQVYWMQAHNPTAQLERTLSEYHQLKYQRPVFPTFSAFHEHGWQPTVNEIEAAISAAKALGLAGCNWWEWANTKRYLPAGWEVIRRSTAWANPPGQQPEPPTETVDPVDPVVTVLQGGLRIRTEPSLDGQILTSLPAGTELTRGGVTIDSPLITWQEVRAWVATRQNGRKLAE